MAWRKIFATLATVLLLAGSAFAFPYDPTPSTIDDKGGYGVNFTVLSGGQPTQFQGFTGDWTNTLRSLNVNQLRVLEFMNQDFLHNGAPKIDWITPAFTADKLAEDRAGWQYLMENPGSNVPASVGRSMYTTQNELLYFIENLPKTNMTVEYLGEIPRGFQYPFLVFSTSSDRSPAGLKATNKPLIWIQGNIHGGEWSGGEGALLLAAHLATGKFDNLLAKVNVIIHPRICQDGAKIPQRATRDNVALQWTAAPQERDLNRDNLLLDLPVTRALKKMNAAYAPHFAIDLHERGNTNFAAGLTNTFGATFDNDAGDIGSSGTTILQIPQELIKIRHEIMEPAMAEFAKDYSITFGLYREGLDTYAHGNSTSFVTWGDMGTTEWKPLPGEYANGPYVDANMVNGMVTSSSFDPDAPYFVISDASYNTRSSRNINAMPGVISQLFENKAGPTNVGNRGMFERRVAAGYVCALATLNTAAARADFFMDTLTAMRAEWIEKGKTVSTSDMIPILPIPPKPSFWNDGNTVIGYPDHNMPYPIIDITGLPTDISELTIENGVALTTQFDGTKAMKNVGAGNGIVGTPNDAYAYVTDESGTRDYQMFKFVWNWQGSSMRERIRPYAYLMDGPYAMEIATRMALAGIEIKRLSADTAVEVEAWHYNQQPYVDNSNSGSNGWRNRDGAFTTKTKTFAKDDTFVIYSAQQLIHLIPLYMEPDLPWNAASCIYLPYMSLALGGSGTGYLSEELIGTEVPVYRYLKTDDLPTYEMTAVLPLVDKGAVARFFDFPTKDEVSAIAKTIKESSIRVHKYDFQVHTRTDSFDGDFEITLPTFEDTKSYMILKKDGTYVPLTVKANKMLGYNVATVVIADHGTDAYTVDLGPNGRPLVDDGANRTLAYDLPPRDDLVGIQIIEILTDSVSGDPEKPKKKSSSNSRC